MVKPSARRAAGALAICASLSCGGEDPLSFFGDPRPCEVRGEICLASAPILLHLADVDRDGRANVITAGLGWELSVALPTDEGYADITTRVPVGGGELSSCSSGEGSDDLIFYRDFSSRDWWLWRLSEGRLEVVDAGRHPITTLVACVDLGLGADAIVILHDTTLALPSISFELQPVETSIQALATMPADDGSTFSLFATVVSRPELYVGTFDLAAGTILEERSLSLGLTRNDFLAVAGRTLIVTGLGDDGPELVLARNLDPEAPEFLEIERVSLPWRARSLELAELDGDGKDEIYALDPRLERIFEVEI
jgi:hypothetical protein